MATIGLSTKDRKLEPYKTGEPIVFRQAETRSFNMRRRMWWPIHLPKSIRGYAELIAGDEDADMAASHMSKLLAVQGLA